MIVGNPAKYPAFTNSLCLPDLLLMTRKMKYWNDSQLPHAYRCDGGFGIGNGMLRDPRAWHLDLPQSRRFLGSIQSVPQALWALHPRARANDRLAMEFRCGLWMHYRCGQCRARRNAASLVEVTQVRANAGSVVLRTFRRHFSISGANRRYSVPLQNHPFPITQRKSCKRRLES